MYQRKCSNIYIYIYIYIYILLHWNVIPTGFLRNLQLLLSHSGPISMYYLFSRIPRSLSFNCNWIDRSEGFPNGIFGSWARWTRAPPDVQSCWETAAVIWYFLGGGSPPQEGSDDGGGDDGVPTSLDIWQSPGPTWPGTKYPVQGIPHFDDVRMRIRAYIVTSIRYWA